MLAGSKAHMQDTKTAHVVDHFLADSLAGSFTFLGVWRQMVVCELADGLA